MEEERIKEGVKEGVKKEIKEQIKKNRPTSGCGYFLGIVGAAVYFISQATTFWAGVLGFLKAIVWPAFIVYEVFKHLGV